MIVIVTSIVCITILLSTWQKHLLSKARWQAGVIRSQREELIKLRKDHDNTLTEWVDTFMEENKKFEELFDRCVDIMNKLNIEGKIKRMLRKWLKKRVYRQGIDYSSNDERFKWVYDAPLREWKDRIWCIDNGELYNSPDLLLKLYLYQ